MTFILPPALPPVLEPAISMETTPTHERLLLLGTTRVHFRGFDSISRERITEVLRPTRTASDVVTQMAALAYLEISPTTEVAYAMVDADLYLFCRQKQITAITGDPALTGLFSDLRGRQAPSLDMLEANRALADVASVRAGYDGGLQFQQRTDGTLDLHVLTVRGDTARVTANGNYSNSGNRFVGHEVAGASVAITRADGAQLQAGGSHALGGGIAGKFDEASVTASAIGSLGILSLSGRGFLYTHDVESFGSFRGTYYNGSLGWTGIFAAGLDNRFVSQFKLDYAQRETVQTATGTKALSERYVYAEPGGGWSLRVPGENWTTSVEAAISGVYGRLVGDESRASVAAQWYVARESFRIDISHDRYGRLTLSSSGQWAPAGSSEQQQVGYGGPSALVAFLPGTFIGNSGAYARLQWSRQVFGVPKLGMQLRAYGEYGRVGGNLGPSAPVARARSGSDAGLGVTAELGPNFSVTLDAARPLAADAAARREQAAFYFSVAIHY